MPTMRQGSKTLGLMIAFGTGGTEADFEAMEEIFYNPSAYDCMEYENVGLWLWVLSVVTLSQYKKT